MPLHASVVLVSGIKRYEGTAANLAASTFEDIPAGSTFLETDTGIIKVLDQAGALQPKYEQVKIAAGTAIIGKVGIDQTTPGTTNKVAVTNLDIALSALRDAIAGAGAGTKTLADINTTLGSLSISVPGSDVGTAAGRAAWAATAAEGDKYFETDTGDEYIADGDGGSDLYNSANSASNRLFTSQIATDRKQIDYTIPMMDITAGKIWS